MNYYNNKKNILWKANSINATIPVYVKNKNLGDSSCGGRKSNSANLLDSSNYISTCLRHSRVNESYFLKKPLKHYRKQYSTVNKSVSNNNFINIFNTPGQFITGNISSDYINHDISYNTANIFLNIINNNNSCDNNCNKFYDSSQNKIFNIGYSGEHSIIKTASTNLDKKYCNTNAQLLKNKCKTYLQNLPSNTNYNNSNLENGTMIECDLNNCKKTYNPSNKRYNNQGPITSSSRIANLRYCNQDTNSRRCFLQKTDYNERQNLNEIHKNLQDTCNSNCKNLRRIRLLP